MDKPYLVRYWHGAPPQSFQTLVEGITRKQIADGQLFFEGRLDQFVELWGKRFLFYPAHADEQQYIAGTIWVTPHSGFGTR